MVEEDIISDLEREFVPLDPALIRAIVFDYDLTSPEDVRTVREQLDTLRASTIADETTSFDPSGTSGLVATNGHVGSSSFSEEFEDTSVVTGVSGLSLDSTSGTGSSSTNSQGHVLDEYVGLGAEGKLVVLKELFPSLRPNDVAYTLKKCDGDINKAMDVLLNQVFFEDSSVLADGEAITTRGIDAFSSETNNATRRGRPKKKNKGKKFQSLQDENHARSNSEPVQAPANKWESANSDITFIAMRVKMPNSTISSLYHKNGASRAKTIYALIEEDKLRGKSPQKDLQEESYAVDLTQDFPSLPFVDCLALIRLTRPSTAYAHELAKALMSVSPESSGMHTPLIPHYAPVKLADASSTPTSTRNQSSSSPPPDNVGDTRALLTMRSTAFENAARYYRLGKSNPLMGGAAAYYSQLGRDHTTSLHTAQSLDADTLVASQSSATVLDLHGVTVRDATRIARDKVQGWWDGLGERRAPGGGRAVGEGYRVVTGVGRHSEGGVGKLGPAVARVLVGEGWRIEVGTGEVVVRGRRKI